MLFTETETKYEYKGKTYIQKHGNAFDRGSADSYYGRGRNPHYWPEGTGHGTRVERSKMTDEEVEAYFAGYDWNEDFGSKKDWG